MNSLIATLVIILSLGCQAAGGDSPGTTPLTRVTSIPAAVVNPTPTAAPSLPDLMPTLTTGERDPIEPSSTLVPTPVPTHNPQGTELTLNLRILAPSQGVGLEVGAIRVLGLTRIDASVTVNGIPTEVGPDGSFARDLILGEGLNSVEAVAKDPSGREVSENLVVLYVPRPEGVPLSILFPQGLEVSDPDLTIMGATRPDAVVGVNGVPAEVNSFGIFTAPVTLEEGTNLIEVVAVDLDENVNFQSVVVFYIPD